ncbi:hypothetical protein BT96DRAFT_1041062, partial [Gymnopus androsaceus JB14]
MFPDKKNFTFMQDATGSQSRIDRIYVTDPILETAREWNTRTSGIPNADHDLVSVQITSENAPLTARGRWRFPEYVVKDKDFLDYAREQGLIAKKELEELNTGHLYAKSPQKIWHTYKQKIIRKGRERARQIVPGLVRKINEARLELDRIANDPLLTDEEKIQQTPEIKKKITQMEQARFNKMQMDLKVKFRLEGETPSRSWSQANKEKKPRDLILALKKPDAVEDEHGVLQGDAYEKESPEMAFIGGEYHNHLQTKDVYPNREEERAAVMQEVLASMNVTTTLEQQESLAAQLTKENVREALRKSKNHTAPGLDGVIYEVWKAIDQQCNEDRKSERESFDIIELMTEVFNDISANGIDEGIGFSDGWMCPLYKKGEKSEIANYRPITLLNTDYKIFTKALAIKL